VDHTIVTFDEAGFRLVPVYKRVWFPKGKKPKGVFFWSNKKSNIIGALIDGKKSRVISYRDISSISKVFNVGLKMNEKHQFLGKDKSKKSRKNHSPQGDYLRENDGSLAFFYIRKY